MRQGRALQPDLDTGTDVGNNLLEGGPEDLAALGLQLGVFGGGPVEAVVEGEGLVAGCGLVFVVAVVVVGSWGKRTCACVCLESCGTHTHACTHARTRVGVDGVAARGGQGRVEQRGDGDDDDVPRRGDAPRPVVHQRVVAI